MRTSFHTRIQNPQEFKEQLLQWSAAFREVAFLDSNNYRHNYSQYNCIVAADAFTSLQTDFHNAWDDLQQYQQSTRDWLFGYLSYDLKNDVEDLKSENHDGLAFADLYFFQPKKLFILNGDQLELQYLHLCDDEIETDLADILKIVPAEKKTGKINLEQRIKPDSYKQKVSEMLAHIQLGDIYEANFCMEFFATDADIDPVTVYKKLNQISTPPFAAFLKNDRNFLMSASPERYLRKIGPKLISQPIKGTARRSGNESEDALIAQTLLISEKERSENIMIVDLVRNDLSRTAAKDSVTVEELCGLYTFKQVHHLISTVTSEIKDDCLPVEALRTTFPMGSMTGAPKISAMEIIEKLEETKRGLYSGSVGYFTPDGDFDFNVVIRSILYNSANKYISFSVGSAITAASDPDAEYAECLLKAQAMHSALS
ncbi:MAG: anthranilate synthase component I family protein [Flavobacterium sp.]|nr:anthranilate synthase component I family protein [Flavobacterium sp.]